ncbi:MAG: SH3 domain-containing protein [Marinibacterium sp.]|nr:SH3 domain-containing protein [Marinibacterium sp.]
MVCNLLSAAALALVAISAAAEDDTRTQIVRFAPGTSGATIQDQITGYEVVRYVLGASVGQRMTIALTTGHTSTYFNAVQPSAPQGPALASSEMAGTNPMVPDLNRFDGVMPETGDYVIEVWMYRSAARRGDVADFTLDIAIGAGAAAAAGSSDEADSLSSGPDWWEVRVGSTLNVHSAPSTSAPTVGRLPNGLVVENRGCQMAEGRKWCQIAYGDAAGWVAGEYLVEIAAPAIAGGGDVKVPGTEYNATGQIPCATAPSMPMAQCDFGVIRRGNGDATVVVTLPGGGQRYLYFDGNASSSDGGHTVWERTGDLNRISVEDEERYEIPDAVRYGG